MPRQRQYATNAERQAAYRARKAGLIPATHTKPAAPGWMQLIECKTKPHRRRNVTKPTVTPTPAAQPQPNTVRVGDVVYELPLTWTSIKGAANAIAFDEVEVKRLEGLKAEGSKWNPTMQEYLDEIKQRIADGKKLVAEFVGANVTTKPGVVKLKDEQKVCFEIAIGEDAETAMVTGRIGLPDDDGSFFGTQADRRKRYAHLLFEIDGVLPKCTRKVVVAKPKKLRVTKISPGWQPGRVAKPTKTHVEKPCHLNTTIKYTYCGKLFNRLEDGRTMLVKEHFGGGHRFEQTNIEMRSVTENPTCKTCANHPDFNNAVFVARYKEKQRNRAIENLERAEELGIIEKSEPTVTVVGR